MGKPVKLGGQAKPFALIGFAIGVGLPVLLVSLSGGGGLGTALIGGVAAGVVAVVFGPRRLELQDGQARLLGGFVSMSRVLADGPIGELKLSEGQDGLGGTLRGQRVDLRNETVWLSQRSWRRLHEALRGQRMMG